MPKTVEDKFTPALFCIPIWTNVDLLPTGRYCPHPRKLSGKQNGDIYTRLPLHIKSVMLCQHLKSNQFQNVPINFNSPIQCKRNCRMSSKIQTYKDTEFLGKTLCQFDRKQVEVKSAHPQLKRVSFETPPGLVGHTRTSGTVLLICYFTFHRLMELSSTFIFMLILQSAASLFISACN